MSDSSPVNPYRAQLTSSEEANPQQHTHSWGASKDEEEENREQHYREELQKQQNQQLTSTLNLSNPEQYHANPTAPQVDPTSIGESQKKKGDESLLNTVQRFLSPLGELFGGDIFGQIAKFILGLALGFVVIQGGKWLMLHLKMSGPADWFKGVFNSGKNLTPFSELAEEVSSVVSTATPGV
jgi:hypothetical protein